jgi:protein-disulfide isomerase
MRSLRHQWFIGWLLLALIGSPCPCVGGGSARAASAADSSTELEALQAELERIKTTLVRIQQELALIRQLLSPRAAQPTAPASNVAAVRIAGKPMLGHKNAPVTLIEFSDYQCPYCARFAQTTLPALKAEYIDTGKVRYVFRDFPMDSLHPHARKAAEAAHCAGEQGQYWKMHDLLFHNQQALQVDQLKSAARRLGIDPARFDACLEKSQYADKVQQDVEEGTAAGVRGTPGFVLGKTRADDTVEGEFIRGAQPLTTFRQAIERLLEEKDQ